MIVPETLPFFLSPDTIYIGFRRFSLDALPLEDAGKFWGFGERSPQRYLWRVLKLCSLYSKGFFMKYIFAFFLIALPAIMAILPAHARDGVLVTLPDKRVAVIAEGDLEPASVGSFSVTVYKTEELTDFVAGGVFERDGSIFDDEGKPRVHFADITGDGKPEMIISSLTAGSGNMRSGIALELSDHIISTLVNFDIASKQDVAEAAKTAYEKTLP
jgi:hypothetical protein